MAGEVINKLLAAEAYNIMKWMRIKRQEIFIALFRWCTRANFAPVSFKRN